MHQLIIQRICAELSAEPKQSLNAKNIISTDLQSLPRSEHTSDGSTGLLFFGFIFFFDSSSSLSSLFVFFSVLSAFIFLEAKVVVWSLCVFFVISVSLLN